MADLIDRQAVIDLLKKSASRDIEEVVVTEKNIKLIMDMPKAYDVDAVIKQLEEAKKKNFESYKEATDTLDIICYGNVVNAYGDAISVVKAGGING